MGDFSWSTLNKRIVTVQKLGTECRIAVLRRGYDTPGDSIADRKYTERRDAGEAALKGIEQSVRHEGKILSDKVFNALIEGTLEAIYAMDDDAYNSVSSILSQSGKTLTSVKQSLALAYRRYDEWQTWVARERLVRLGPSGKRDGAWRAAKLAWPELDTVPTDVVIEPDDEQDEELD